MAGKNTVRFEHRHLHDWKFLKAFYLHTLRAAPVYVAVWGGLLVLCGALAVRSAAVGSAPFTALYVVLALMCLLRGFLAGLIRLRRNHREACRRSGRDSWVSILRFRDSGIEMEDEGQATARVAWSDCQRLEDQGAWLRLCFRGGRGELYLRKAEFTLGRAEAFQSWLAEQHPEIAQSGRDGT